MKWMIAIICVFLLTGCNEKKVVQNENNQKVETQVTNQVEEKQVPNETSKQQVSYEEPKKIEEVENSSSSNQNVPVKEEQVEQNINTLEQEVTVLLAGDNSETIKEKVISKFITLVDFVYYDAPIGNVYFKELTASAQQKIREVLTRMDQAIESKLPNYKENVNEKYHSVLNYVKTKTDSLTSKASEKIEETIGSDNYQNFIDGANDMKESFKNTAEWIKEGTSKIYENGKEKVSSWYQGLKEKYDK